MELNIRLLVERGERYFPGSSVVTRLPDGGRHTSTWGEVIKRSRRLASRFDSLGIKAGERVGTLAWNSYRHLELYVAAPCAGRVLHTINLRLADEHVVYILNHCEDAAVFVDPDQLPLIERIVDQVRTVRHWIVLADKVPPTRLQNVIAYEDLVAAGDPAFPFHEIPENTPAVMCYTSATTGMPKGVSYSQRVIYLHSLTASLGDVLDVRERDTFLLMVPMFHANGWGLPYACAAMGAQVVLPGERPHAPLLLDLVEREKVTFIAAAVSVGIDMIAELRRKRRDLSSLRAIMLGGSATPASVMEYFLSEFGIPIQTAWGSTELAPLATCAHIPRRLLGQPAATHIPVRVRQGIPVPGAELKVLDEGGNEVPWNDQVVGEAFVRAPWSAAEYYRDPKRSAEGFRDGWWRSGDMATVNDEGVLRLVDRAKDLIKSGGEWISSVDLENALVAHPAVREAAVVALPDEKWVERPVAYYVREPGASVTADELRAWLEPKFARWWLPAYYLPTDAIPKTGVGKINKRALRESVVADVVRLGKAAAP